MLTSPRVLFHVRNRRGLGHMMRGLNVAQALRERAPQARLKFHLRAAPAAGFWPQGVDYVVQGGGDPVACVAAFGPHVQVFDTMLPDADELARLHRAAPASRFAFVMRRCLPQEQLAIYAHPALASMDLLLVPHTPEEFGLPVPADLRPRCHFVGPIARLPSAQAQACLGAKYGLATGDFLLTSTVGGGGFADQADTFFNTVRRVHERLCTQLGASAWRHIVVLGPNFAGGFPPSAGMSVVPFEPDLINLLALSDLVVAEGGYNTVSELVMTRTPALFLPSVRGKDDQFGRVQRLADAGCARVFEPTDVSGIAAAVCNLHAQRAGLLAMQRCYPRSASGLGNCEAARRIHDLAAQAAGTATTDRRVAVEADLP